MGKTRVTICCVCGETMPWNICAYWNINPAGESGHMYCIDNLPEADRKKLAETRERGHVDLNLGTLYKEH